MPSSASAAFLRRLWEVEEGTDLIIRSKDGSAHRVHKVVVCEQSNYIASMVAYDPGMTELDVETQYEVLEAVLRHLYGFEFSFEEDVTLAQKIFKMFWAASQASTRLSGVVSQSADLTQYELPKLRVQIEASVVDSLQSYDTFDIVYLADDLFSQEWCSDVSAPQGLIDELVKRTSTSMLSIVADSRLLEILLDNDEYAVAVLKEMAKSSSKDRRAQAGGETGIEAAPSNNQLRPKVSKRKRRCPTPLSE